MGMSPSRNLRNISRALCVDRRGSRWTTSALAVAAILALFPAAGSGQQPPPPNPNKPYLLPEANRPPDKNAQMQMREQQSKKKDFENANEARLKQISAESDQLLTLAMALKAEVDKTGKDTLSLNVIRKADQIEKLAHNVKEKMKLVEGAG